MRKRLGSYLRMILVSPFLIGWFVCAAIVHLMHPDFSRTIWIEVASALARKGFQ